MEAVVVLVLQKITRVRLFCSFSAFTFFIEWVLRTNDIKTLMYIFLVNIANKSLFPFSVIYKRILLK